MYSYTIDSAQQGPSVWLLGRPICVCLSPLNMSYFAGPAVVLLSYICFILQVQQLSYCLIFVLFFSSSSCPTVLYLFILQVQQLSSCLIFVLFCRSNSCPLVLYLFYFAGPAVVLLSYICFILQVQQLSSCLVFFVFCRSSSCPIVLYLLYFAGQAVVLLSYICFILQVL